MARPQRSTRDAWLDQFADWPAEVQERMLDTCQLLHRQTVRLRELISEHWRPFESTNARMKRLLGK